jgi:GAF domain-containing protein
MAIEPLVQPSLEVARRAQAGVLRVRIITLFIALAVAINLPASAPWWVRPGAFALAFFVGLVASVINGRAKNVKTIRWTARSVLVVDFIALAALVLAYEPAYPATWVGLVIFTAIAAAQERYMGALATGVAGTIVILISNILHIAPQTGYYPGAGLLFQVAVLWLNALNVSLLVREIDERNQALVQRSQELSKAALVEEAMLAETRAQAATLRKVVELSVTLMRERELATLLDRILEATIKAFGFRAGSILVADRDREAYRYSAVRGYGADVAMLLRQREVAFAQVDLKMDKRFVMRPSVFYAPVEHQAWFTDPSLVFDRTRLGEARNDPQEWNEADTLIFQLHSSSGDVIGLLVPDAPSDGRVPSLETIDSVALFAHLAAAAIENIHLFTTEQRRAEELTETNREIQRLYREAESAAETRRKQAIRLASILDLTAAIFKERDLDRVLTRILEVALSQFNFAAGTIVLRDPTRNVLVRRAAIGFPGSVVGQEISDAEMQATMTPRARVRDTYYYAPMELHIAGGVTRNPQLSRLPRGGPGQWHEDDLLLFPFFDSNGTLIGVLSPDEPSDRLVPDDETVRTIEVFAQLASVAVEGARLREAAGGAAVPG